MTETTNLGADLAQDLRRSDDWLRAEPQVRPVRLERSVRALVVTRYSPQHTRLHELVVQALTSRAVEGMQLPLWSGKGSDG